MDTEEKGAVIADADAITNGSDPAPRSVLDQVRKRLGGKRHIHLAVPASDGAVIVRYGRFPKKAVVTAAQIRNADYSNASLLAAACLEVFFRSEDDGKIYAARQFVDSAEPVKFDGRLGELLGVEGEDSPRIVMAVYADSVAIAEHCERIRKWQSGEELDEVSSEEIEERLGEAPAAT